MFCYEGVCVFWRFISNLTSVHSTQRTANRIRPMLTKKCDYELPLAAHGLLICFCSPAQLCPDEITVLRRRMPFLSQRDYAVPVGFHVRDGPSVTGDSLCAATPRPSTDRAHLEELRGLDSTHGSRALRLAKPGHGPDVFAVFGEGRAPRTDFRVLKCVQHRY